jgi:hypothetical protein
MADYELGVLTSVVTSGTPAAEIRAGSDPIFIKEIGLFLTAATASKLGIGRPANTIGAGGTSTLLLPSISEDPAAFGGIVLSGQTTVPTVPTNFLRRIDLPAAIGNGIVFTWGGKGLRIKASTSLVIWNLQANSALDMYVVAEE